jgi:hypothetical protein
VDQQVAMVVGPEQGLEDAVDLRIDRAVHTGSVLIGRGIDQASAEPCGKRRSVCPAARQDSRSAAGGSTQGVPRMEDPRHGGVFEEIRPLSVWDQLGLWR